MKNLIASAFLAVIAVVIVLILAAVAYEHGRVALVVIGAVLFVLAVVWSVRQVRR